MNSPKFDYEVNVQEIRGAPIGRFRYAANIVHLQRHDADGSVTQIQSPVIDCWGEDFQKAAEKARAKIDAWIAAQGSGSTGSLPTKNSSAVRAVLSGKALLRFVDRSWIDDLPVGPDLLARMAELEDQGMAGRALINELFGDYGAAPARDVTITWKDDDGREHEKRIYCD
jgi:hypothetical protein